MRCINCDHVNKDPDDIHYGECFLDGIIRDPYEKIECDNYKAK